jgi:uncharacterized membrane protein
MSARDLPDRRFRDDRDHRAEPIHACFRPRFPQTGRNEMLTKVDQGAPRDQRPQITPPVFPSTPSEFITVVVHYHRAEIARMAGWRDRIDRTTNWAITVVAAMLSVSLSTPTAHHGVLLFAMLLVLLLLVIESRRYRFFDVYRGRVRRLERYFFAQIFAPEEDTKDDWIHMLGDDLRRPLFLIGRRQAFARRLRRNYGWMFLILLIAWLLKTSSIQLEPSVAGTEFVRSFGEWLRNAAIGPVSGGIVIVPVALLYGWILYMTVVPQEPKDPTSGPVRV